MGQANLALDEFWPTVVSPLIASTAEDSLGFLIDRSFMRPRNLIDLVRNCFSSAVTLGHNSVTASDLKEGLESYSVELARNISFEIRNVYDRGTDVIFALLGSEKRLPKSQLFTLLLDYGVGEPEKFIELLMWYGVIGLVNTSGDAKYIHDERYEMQKLYAVHRSLREDADPMFEINPAFWAALELDAV